MSRILAAATVVLAAALAGIVLGVPRADGASDAAAILFAKDDGVYVRAGTRVRRLTARAGAPAWSPDRRQIAFVRLGDIHVMRANGSGQRRLTRGRAADVAPTWSPDGRSIAFVSNRGNRPFALYLMRADGSNVRRLTGSVAQAMSMQPAFSPDGRSLVYAADVRGGASRELFRIGVDGRGRRQLTSIGPADQPAVAHMPSYSPDGKRIAFVLGRQSGSAIWTVEADGTGLRQVTRHAGRDHAWPRYSPSGRSLVYATFRPDASYWEDYDFRLYKVRTDGTGRTFLGRGFEPDW